MPGLDRSVLDTINSELALRRIRRDTLSDFIVAPHYNAIFVRAGDELWGRTSEQLRSGTYSPQLPLTLPVPKPGGFTRPGSILQPIDRLVYQALADLVAPILEEQMDRKRSFSHVLTSSTESDQMFEPESQSWDQMQARLQKIAAMGGWFVKADVANYFERIPQHHLINLMTATGCRTEITRLLEEMLLAFKQRDSSGIIQGVFPSDLFGNYYLTDLDAYCEVHDVPSVRYVDDLYLYFETRPEAARGLIRLVEQLRHDGLHLNEGKSGVSKADSVLKEETTLDDLFAEVREQLEAEKDEEEKLERGYGFPVDWDLSNGEDIWENNEEDEEMVDEDHDDLFGDAVIRLFESIEEYQDHTIKIERFCLPFLREMGSDIAVERTLNGIISRPYMSRTYLSYLSGFIGESTEIKDRLEGLMKGDALISDYQRMYILATLSMAPKVSREAVKITLQLLQDLSYAQETRAIAAILAAKHGAPVQRRAVRLAYEGETSPYVRAAILYASRHFTGAERRTCIKAWGGHSIVNALVAHALKGE
ncbi:MAG: hypothetical protein ISS66_02930 [Desulfobacteraceae bacterium]|nr:hypothetical protein [Desulfobacteraceae bacterium]